VLRPGGTLGLVWNFRDERVPWVAALVEATSREWLAPGWSDPLAPYFAPFERRDVAFVQVLPPEDVVALIGSRSVVLTLPAAERAAKLAEVRDLVTTHPALAGRATVEIPYVTQAYRAKRL
jgi:hypothetical protein